MVCPSCDYLFAAVISKNKKSHVLHFNNYDSESKLDLYHFLNILTPYFFIYYLSSICWFISSLPSKNSKISFQGSQNVLACNVHIYLPMAIWSRLKHRYPFPTENLVTFSIKHVLFSIDTNLTFSPMDYDGWCNMLLEEICGF